MWGIKWTKQAHARRFGLFGRFENVSVVVVVVLLLLIIL